MDHSPSRQTATDSTFAAPSMLQTAIDDGNHFPLDESSTASGLCRCMSLK